MTLIGYTLGNPEAYELALEGDEPVRKAVGGAFFPTYGRAMAAMEKSAQGQTMLPSAWGLSHLPGRVYELHRAGGCECTFTLEDLDEVGAGRLLTEGLVRRVDRR